ncbi:MAG: HAD family phosphatase [Endomicrobium sp.]|jgi:beta-phosphoglucomutase|nr:HAD family phosphatase [Endomicrobium sp.]
MNKKLKEFNPKFFKAALFDMDGVIMDSMPYHFISWFEVLKQYDVRINPMIIFEMEGAKWDKVIKLAFKQSGKPLLRQTTHKIREEREQIFNQYFKKYIFTGMPEFIESLKNNGVLVGLVTGSSLKEAQKMLPKNVYGLFDTIVTGDKVKRGKPYPDPYLIAAQNLKVLSEECVVIENAPYGIKSAKAAKMYCCAIATSLPEAFLSKADIIFDTHRDLYECFKK